MKNDRIFVADRDIIAIDKDGIHLCNGYIDLHQCAANYHAEHGGSGRCVGEREITAMYFDFYTAPKKYRVTFLARNKWFETFSRNSAAKRFRRLQEQLLGFGFTTRDLS